MTLTPEQRAQSVVRSLMEPLDNGKPYLETPFRKVMAEAIAAAIREAENDALERVAVALEVAARAEEVFGIGDAESLLHKRAKSMAAEFVRLALKTRS